MKKTKTPLLPPPRELKEEMEIKAKGKDSISSEKANVLVTDEENLVTPRDDVVRIIKLNKTEF